MYKKRTPDELTSYTSNQTRKKLSSQYLDRIKSNSSNSNFLNSTTKTSIETPKTIRETTTRSKPTSTPSPVIEEKSLITIIQSKVANLKNKFGELDQMKKRLIESRCEIYDDESKKSSSFFRPHSTEFKSEPNSRELSFTNGNDTNWLKTSLIEKFDNDLRNERKTTQKILIEKSLLERESLEKTKSMENDISLLNLELENNKLKLLGLQKELQESERIRKHQESYISNQQNDIKSLESRLSSSDSTIKYLHQKVKKLEKNLKDSKENSSSTANALKNLSYIILSKDSPAKTESSASQLASKYLETLRELEKSDKFTLSLIDQLESNNLKKAIRKLLLSKPETIARTQQTIKNIENLENFMSENRSPRLSFTENFANTSESLKKEDFVSWMTCQASMVEDLLMISELGNDFKIASNY